MLHTASSSNTVRSCIFYFNFNQSWPLVSAGSLSVVGTEGWLDNAITCKVLEHSWILVFSWSQSPMDTREGGHLKCLTINSLTKFREFRIWHLVINCNICMQPCDVTGVIRISSAWEPWVVLLMMAADGWPQTQCTALAAQCECQSQFICQHSWGNIKVVKIIRLALNVFPC